jgi:hypothetical protein
MSPEVMLWTAPPPARECEGAGSELVAVLAQKSTDGNLAATKGYRLADLTPLR